ncbi:MULTISPECIES: hypothetical protein [Myxococcus]|nr:MULTISPECIES: hypothetical protein [Myxococcus]
MSISLAGSDALYELGVSALTAQLDGQDTASLLHVGSPKQAGSPHDRPMK